ncbi:D-alanyl-D-alanine carboxypeptidase [Flavobacterium magnum]|uniref:D-alanyl-D-alanine carboxypeptidase n=1 Tax=Flavobacterium magnum TaxID=2162713 RepID=A0A2S0RDY9_9FLAO|nr:serine hydrolase domain-containing protein [Flavobacterium magnum]AWA29510.1 D-alanyl-D-alanine carboxypeptidase [Flavobacterium magnum]
MKKTLLLLWLCLSAKNITAQGTEKFSRLDSALTYLASNNRFMGSICLRDKDQIVFSKAYGFADVENNTKATPKTKYKIGSITKMFTSAIIFQLVEEKKLALDTKLSKFFPQVKNADKITITNLLNHSSGIYNFTNDSTFIDFSRIPQTQESMLKRIAAYAPDFAPGTKSDYSNSNYLILGYIIEKITKKSYPDNVAGRIIKKAGLTDTKYYGPIMPANNEAFSYNMEGAKWSRQEEWQESVAYAAGALQSTPDDLTRFIRALFEGKIITKNSLDQMTAIENGFGKGIFAFPFNDKKFFGHTGGIEGFSSSLGYNKEDGAAFAMTVNAANYDTNKIAIMALSAFYGKAFEFPEVKNISIDEKILRNYVGTYATPTVPLKLTIAYEDGTLTAQATGQGAFPLEARSETEFIFDQAGIKITFGENTMVLDQGGMKFDFKKETP